MVGLSNSDLSKLEHKCLWTNCEKNTINIFCQEHYLYKEFRYGWYDLKTNNKGFRKWAIKRIYKYIKYKLFNL